ncbi:MAG: DUF6528 family protein [Candidatus Cryptobacteroides sp.]
MKKDILIFLALILTLQSCEKHYGEIIPLPPLEPASTGAVKRMALADQSEILIVNATTKETEWSWTIEETSLLTAEKARFGLFDEVKPIYNGKYLLITATRGAVAILRISDKKLMFYAFPMGQPHSAEVLPDGNVVVACSDDGTSDGNKLKVYAVDTTEVYSSSPLLSVDNYFSHNAVWDNDKKVLWATAGDVLNAWAYSNAEDGCTLVIKQTFELPGSAAHELFPVYGLRQLWLTTGSGIYKFDTSNHTFNKLNASANTNIKCVSSGSAEFETIIISPTESYWTDKIIDTGGRVVWSKTGARFYKARWMLDNIFSYPENNPFVNSK